MPARTGHRPVITTEALLDAIATRGRRWTDVFASHEIVVVNEALDRELLSGNLIDAVTLSTQGETVLADLRGRTNDQGKIDLRINHGCREHSPCWTIACVRCDTKQFDHVTEDVLSEQVQKVLAGHICLGHPDTDP